MPQGHDISEATPRGGLTAPAVPASTVALTNPFDCACLVTIQGTASVVTVNGVSITMLGGLYVVPKGGTIALTYLSAPTWSWYGLV